MIIQASSKQAHYISRSECSKCDGTQAPGQANMTVGAQLFRVGHTNAGCGLFCKELQVHHIEVESSTD
jgi:hypothetical protein